MAVQEYKRYLNCLFIANEKNQIKDKDFSDFLKEYKRFI